MATVTQRRASLADLLPGAVVRDVALVALGAILTGLCAQVTIHLPGTPVPITGQTFGVLLSGAALGLRRATASMVLYMVAGLAGVPWFAQGSHGYVGVTFGYIVGFIVAAAVVGWLAERGGDRTVVRTVATMLVGTALIYLVGATWLAISAQLSATMAFQLGVQPFLWGDLLKLLLAAGILPGAWFLAGRARR
jgi:biotin transport system substrate-specific component